MSSESETLHHGDDEQLIHRTEKGLLGQTYATHKVPKTGVASQRVVGLFLKTAKQDAVAAMRQLSVAVQANCSPLCSPDGEHKRPTTVH
jgi:hypothetical protein